MCMCVCVRVCVHSRSMHLNVIQGFINIQCKQYIDQEVRGTRHVISATRHVSMPTADKAGRAGIPDSSGHTQAAHCSRAGAPPTSKQLWYHPIHSHDVSPSLTLSPAGRGRVRGLPKSNGRCSENASAHALECKGCFQHTW